MKLRDILKKTSAVVLVFAMLAPIMGNLEVNIKEVEASETISNVESDDSLDVKFQVTQGVVTETDIEAYKGKYVMRAVSAIQNPEAYDYIGFKAVRADKIQEGMTDEQIEDLAIEVRVKTVFKRIDSTTGLANGEKETYTYSPKVVDTTGEYFVTAKFVIAEKNKDVDYVIWVCGSKNGTKVSGQKRQVCVNDGIEGCSTINMSFENTSDVALTKANALTAKNVDKDSAELGIYSADIIGVYGNIVNVRVDKKDASEVAISLKSANKFDFYTTGESTALVGSEILRHHTIQYDGTNTDTSWYDLYATDNVRDDFIIATSADLYGFAYLINTKHYSLMQDRIYVISDIVVNKDDVTTWGTSINSGGYDWTPIGNASYQFKGVFDAQMHTISGLYHSVGSVMYNGFFGRTQSATIKNLKLTNCYFRNQHQYFGSISGYDRGSTFDTIYSDAIVNGSSYNGGGLVGRTGNGTIMTNCWFDGRVASSRSGRVDIGGLVGIAYAETTTITNCLNTGAVTATNASGSYFSGLVGYVGADTGTGVATLQLNTSFNAGKVNVQTGNTAYGCFVGEVKDGSTLTLDTKSYATFESCGVRGYDSDYLIRTNKEATLKGVAAATTLQDASFDSAIWTLDSGYTPILKSFESTYVDDTWYKPDSNTTEYVLYDAADLYGLSRLSQTNNFEGITIKLGDNITVNDGNKDDWGTTAPERYWLPIGNVDNPFMGTFDGYNEESGGIYEVSGLYYKATGTGSVGFFSRTGTSATLQNFKLLNSYFHLSNKAYIGSIAGVAKGTIHNVHAEAYVFNTNNRVGGLVGDTGSNTKVDNVVIGLSMTKCSYKGTVESSRTGELRIGGLVGCIDSANTTISDCLNEGTVSATGTSAAPNGIGGLVGYVTNNGSTGTKIENSLNIGTVTSAHATPSNKDSIIGYSNTATINNLYSTSATDTTKAGFNQVSVDDIKGEDAKTALSGFDFLTTWVARENDTPTLDFENSGAYVIRNLADLNKIVEMSKTTNFAGKTIKLANNIDLTDVAWTPIGTSSSATRFAGTFDGQGYTISNLHVETTADYSGLFAATAPEAVVKNLIIEGANVTSTAKIAGIVAGLGHGTFSDIRVENATLTGGGRLGGLIGLAQNSVTLSNCSFSGTVTCVGAEKENRYIGGLLGYVTGGTLKISNCMNVGTIIGSADCTSDNPGVGGLIGCLNGAKSVAINSCVNVGTITVEATAAVLGVGPIIGRYTAPSGGFEMFAIEKCYTVPSKDLVGINGIAEVTVDAVKADAETTMPLLDWTTQWESVDGNFPKVRFSKTGFVASESMEVDSTSLTNLTTVYSASQVLKQGDIHAHAGNGGGSDGTVSLADWKTQMTDLDMDFAASLDHRETDHILLPDWDKDKFIYGTELGTNIHDTYIDGNELGLHYNMIYSNMEDFVGLLTETEFEDDFDYSETAISGGYYNGGHIKEAGFDTAEEYKRFIQAVQQYNGFYVLAHPMTSPSYITADNWKQALQPYLVNGIGIEVMYKGLGTTNVKQGYQLWKRLLNNGYQVYATAGTDTHADLQTSLPDSGVLESLTSFYAAIGTGETNWSEAYVRYLREGNFTAGSVGLQMCVGSTQMGGTGSFEDAYLEIGIGALHKSVYDSTHKYRVDVWSEDGIMYSQPFNATKEEGQMTYLRTKADSNCKYYRVEIYDVTTNTRIALGNPIWNNAEDTTAE